MKFSVFLQHHKNVIFHEIWHFQHMFCGWVLIGMSSSTWNLVDLMLKNISKCLSVTFSSHLDFEKSDEVDFGQENFFFKIKISIFKKLNLMSWYGCKSYSESPNTSNLSPKLFCNNNSTYFWSTIIFSEIYKKPYLPCLDFFEQNIPGMSSYDPRSSSIKKYEFWRIFWIPIILSYLQ